MSHQMPGAGGPGGPGFGPFHGNNLRGGFGFSRGFHHVHPGVYAHAYRPRFRFFPRLFWFAMGAGAYAMWRNHKERELPYHGANGGGDERPREWGCWKGRERERMRTESTPVNAAAASYSANTSLAQELQQGHDGSHARPGFQRQWSWGSNAWNNNNPSQQQQLPRQPIDEPRVDVTVDWHSEKVREMGKQATDAMSDVSEAALDHLLSSIQALKAKIAENRAQREQNEPLPLEQRIPVEQQPTGHTEGREPRRYV